MTACARPGFGALAAFALGACATPLGVHEIADLRRHVVSADAEGAPIDPVERGPQHHFQAAVEAMLRSAAGEAGRRETLDTDLDCGFEGHDHRGARRVRKLLVHVHGGLNGDEASLRRALEKLHRIDAEPGSDWHYPIFLTWPSGGINSVGEHLTSLRFGSHLRPWSGYPSAPCVTVFDLIQGAARAPRTHLAMLTNDIQVGLEVAFGIRFLPTWRRAEELESVVAHPTKHEDVHRSECADGLRVHLGEYSRGGLGNAWLMTRYLVLLAVKLLVTPLLIDGFGKEAWDVMLHRASNTLRPTAEFETYVGGHEGGKLREQLAKPATGTFARFFRRLDAFVEEATLQDRNVCWEITLIGHSMGAIILNDALQLYPKLPVRNLVFMAPACSIAEAEEAIVPYLERHAKTRFYILTLHPLAEAGEVVAWDLPSRGSLLEWIDQWFETPEHSLDRRLGKWNNAIGALHVFASVRERVTLKGFAVEGPSIPQKHGDFNECPFWRREFWEAGGPDRFP